MTPTLLRVRSVTALHDVEVDLSAVPPGLCAVVGDNGAGKTSLIECMLPAPLWLSMPTRPGTLADNVTGRDGLIELHHVHQGRNYRHLITVDAGLSRPRTEAYLYVDGEPVNDGKLRTYQEVVAQHLPPEHLVLASSFAAQDGAGSFAQLDTRGRRALFRTMLGLDHLQALADRATLHRRPLDAIAGELDRRAERLEQDAALAAQLEEQIRQQEQVVEEERERARLAAQVEHAARAAHATEAARLEDLAAQRAQAIEQLGQLRQELERVHKATTTTREELHAADKLLERAEELEAAQERREALRALRAQARTDYSAARAELDRLQRAEAARAEELRRCVEDLHRVHGDLERASAQDLEQLRTRAARLEQLRSSRPSIMRKHEQAIEDWRQALTKAQEKLDAAKSARAEAARKRAEAEASAAQLDEVPCKGRTLDNVTHWGAQESELVECGTCPMLVEAVAARKQLPALIEAALEAAAQEGAASRAWLRVEPEARTTISAREQQMRDLDATISTLAGADTALEVAEALSARRQELETRAEALDARRSALEAEALDAARAAEVQRATLEAAEASGRAARAALEAQGDLDGQLVAIQRAEGRRPLLHRSLTELETRAEALALDVERSAARVPAAPAEQAARAEQAEQRLQQAAESAQGAQERVETLLGGVATLRGRRAALGDLGARRAALSTRREQVAQRRAGLVWLERAFGPEGIQALEIDAAGPGVSDLANTLLTSVGAAYSVELRTVREAERGRKQREVFDVVVHDGRSGASRELGRMSGGEQVLVQEAIKLAIAVHVAQRTGQGLATIWRDECDGALSDTRARMYPAMLRAAAELGGFSRCYFVTHRPDVAAQADSILLVRRGGVELLDPGAYASTHQASKR